MIPQECGKEEMELRTKSLDEAITKNVVISHGDTRVIEYCPGDGTRYVLVFASMPALTGWVTGGVHDHTDSILVSLINFSHGPSMVVKRNGGFLAPTYVGEKLGLNRSSAITLAEIIARFTGREALSPEEYRERHTENEK